MILSTFINLGTDFTSSTLANAGVIVSDLSTYLTLTLGVLLGVLVITFLIRALHR